MPSWMAFDMRLMSERFLTDGMVPEAGDVERLTALLGRPLRSYRDFASEIATSPEGGPDTRTTQITGRLSGGSRFRGTAMQDAE